MLLLTDKRAFRHRADTMGPVLVSGGVRQAKSARADARHYAVKRI